MQVELEAEVEASLEHEFEAAKEKVASLSSLFEDEELVQVDAGVQDETLLVRCSPVSVASVPNGPLSCPTPAACLTSSLLHAHSPWGSVMMYRIAS